MVVKSLDQLERNVSASFGYVKKDILMVNDAVSNVHDKIQHLSLNQALLLEKIEKLQKTLDAKNSSKKKPNKKKSTQKKLEFYDVKAKKKFKTSEYIIRNVKGKKMAVAVSPSKTQAYRMLGTIKGSKNKSKKKVSAKTTKPKVAKQKKEKTVSQTPKKVITETVLYE